MARGFSLDFFTASNGRPTATTGKERRAVSSSDVASENRNRHGLYVVTNQATSTTSKEDENVKADFSITEEECTLLLVSTHLALAGLRAMAAADEWLPGESGSLLSLDPPSYIIRRLDDLCEELAAFREDNFDG